MDLKEFTKQTLVQIVEGVHETNTHFLNKKTQAKVKTENRGNFCDVNYSTPISINVDFDVAVTSAETTSGDGGAAIKVAGLFDVGGKVRNKVENQTISHVKYTLQITLGSE